jgi:diketogulonate reductase-like aldo/keto reductase
MLTRPIPKTAEPLPVIGLGTWQTFDVGSSRADLDQRKQVLQVLMEAGGKVIDSSPMYGRAEAVVGTLLAEMQARDKVFLATKVWTAGEAAGVAQMNASLAKLKAPALELMQIHNLVDWRTHLRTLRAWKERKTFRYIGITHYTVPALDELAAIIRAEPIDFVQFGYSINVREAETRLLPLCAASPSSPTSPSTAAASSAKCAERCCLNGQENSTARAGASFFSSSSSAIPPSPA